MGSLTKRECARGDRCTQYERLGRPAPLTQAEKRRTLCDSCARRHVGAVRASNNKHWARKTLETIKTAEGRGSDYEVSLWDLFELDHTNGGHGRKSNLGKTLDCLDPTTLDRVREWIDDNTGEAIERYGS